MNDTAWAGSDSKHINPVFVGMFDVLGFGNIVKNTEPEILLDKYRFLQQQKRDAATVPELSAKGVKIWKVPTTVFSDTILVWANDKCQPPRCVLGHVFTIDY